MIFHFLAYVTNQVVGDECGVIHFTVPETSFKSPRTLKGFQSIKQSSIFYLTTLYRLLFYLVGSIELPVGYIYLFHVLYLFVCFAVSTISV